MSGTRKSSGKRTIRVQRTARGASVPKIARKVTRVSRKKNPRAKPPRLLPAWLRLTGSIALRASAAGFLAITGGAAALYWFGQQLPSVENIATARHTPRITIVDRYGYELRVHGKDRGAPVDVASLPPHVVNAFLATEDRTFYHHMGVNPLAILRALTVNLQSRERAQGGSTITQQLVKNVILTPEKTYARKVQEMLLALRIEATYEKDEILSHYLNAVYFGNNAYGIEAAARRYFAKAPEALSIGEAAMLAGLLKAPSRYAPTHDIQGARSRAAVVLSLMVSENFITQDEMDNIIQAGVAEAITHDQRTGYAAQYAIDQAESLLGSFDVDAIVYTTIDREAIYQTQMARNVIASEDPLYTEEVQTAAISMERNGAIRVLIGGNDYGISKFNRAVQAQRQPGSVFKPFVYLAALEQGWRPEDYVDDTQITIGEYQPQNYKGRYYGKVPLTEALSRSLNSAAIRLQEDVGRELVVDVARRTGMAKIVDIGPALALGVIQMSPLDVARGYLPFANEGVPAEPYIVTHIVTPNGEVLYERLQDTDQIPVFDRETLIAFDHMLRTVVATGSGRNGRVRGHYAAGKTGTSQDSRDAWFAGYASGMVGVTWLGKDNDTPMDNGRDYISGSGAPARLWSAMMTASLGERKATKPVAYIAKPKPLPRLELEEFLLGLELEEGVALQPTEEIAPADDISQLMADISL